VSISCRGWKKSCFSPAPSPALSPAIVGQGRPRECKSNVLEKKSAPLGASRAESFLQATGVKPIVVGCYSRRAQFVLLLGDLILGYY